MTITTVKARFTFLYLPEQENFIRPEEIVDEAAEWLCGRVDDFLGWGENDTVDIIEVYTKNYRNLVEFDAEFVTEDLDGVVAYADTLISYREEF